MTKNPALDCGINPNDGLLVAYLPKMDAVLQEHDIAGETVYSIDGIVLDVRRPKGYTRWWQVRRAAFELGLALPGIIWQDRAGDFTKDDAYAWCASLKTDLDNPEHKLYMRAYSRGPWICIEQEQLDKVYGAVIHS